MLLEQNKRQILHILSENLKVPQPEVLDSTTIAEKLHMDVPTTCQLVKILNETGEVVSDQDGEHCLITSDGLHWLQDKTAMKT